MPNRSNLTEFEELSTEIQRKVSAEWHRRLNRIMSGSQAMILWKLEKHGPLKITTLAEHMSITPGAITSISDKLISSGYAIRSRDISDRRIVNLEITEKGRELLREIKVEVKSVIAHMFAGLPDEDINHLIRIYKQVLKNLNEQQEE